MTLTPAYGRDYKSKKEVQADLDADKDFLIADIMSPWNGKPANRTQLKEQGLTSVMVRYKRLTAIQSFKL